MTDDEGGISIDWQRHWMLDPGTTFLNHGSFGACPKRVLKEQRELREQMERQPVRFFEGEYAHLLDRTRAELADFVGADPEGLVLVPNATAGVNAVLRSREFDPGDELLVTDHGYEACRHAIDYVAERSGASVVVAELPFPCEGPDQLVESIMEAVTPKTELAIIDHVTSPTGLVLPVERLVEELDDRHVETLVDGAHAPGMLDLSVDDVGANYYTGNCHKWMCAPKGAAFLWVGEHERDDVHPLSISNYYKKAVEGRSSFQMEFDWTGTFDPTSWFAVPAAIEFIGSLLPDGWAQLRERNQKLAIEARDLLCETLEVDPPAPDAMLGSLATLPLPDRGEPAELGAFETDPLQAELRREHGFEVPIIDWPQGPSRLLRVSCQLYNHREQYERLAGVLGRLLA
jgi:isopenicillin-N epimerase